MVIVKVPSSASVTCASSQAFSSPTPAPSIWRKVPSAGAEPEPPTVPVTLTGMDVSVLSNSIS